MDEEYCTKLGLINLAILIDYLHEHGLPFPSTLELDPIDMGVDPDTGEPRISTTMRLSPTSIMNQAGYLRWEDSARLARDLSLAHLTGIDTKISARCSAIRR